MIEKTGFEMPDSVRLATEDYKKSSDKIGQFVEDEMDADPNAEVSTNQAYSRYQQWCESNGHGTENSKNFKTSLSTIATIIKKRPKDGGGSTNLIVGYRLKHDPDITPVYDFDPKQVFVDGCRHL